MSDSIDDNQLHMPERSRTPKYGQCSHCRTYSANYGKCPFCGKGEIK